MFPVLSANGSSGYNLTNSLRFRSSASAYLSRTPASAGSQTTWTWSGWVKRGILGSQQKILTAGSSGSLFASIDIIAGDNLQFYAYNGATNAYLVTTQVFRDPSAWYYITFVCDTTQATAANRLKLYINGLQVTSFSTATYPTQNFAFPINNNVIHNIGRDNINVANYFDGYMTEVNFIDGQALTPSSFGNYNSTTGVWQPAKYTGTYGTNGFYLNFNSIALTSGSNTGLGKDNSGNGNYWNTNNISVTAGTTYDAMTDVPINTSATVANYAVLNPLATVSQTTSNGNLSVNYGGGATNRCAKSSLAVSSGKWYWEFKASTLSASGQIAGVCSVDALFSGGAVSVGYEVGYYSVNGNKYVNGTGSAYGASWTTSDIIGVALDVDGGTVTFYKNNTSQGSISITAGQTWVASWTGQFTNDAVDFTFGQRPFTYTPPTGFVALNTYNLPTPTILQGNKYMDATLYTGTSASLTVTNAAGFKPDFVWTKARSFGYDHGLFDSVRGATKFLSSNATTAEQTLTNTLTAFNSNGFTVDANGATGATGTTYVGWQWQAGQGSSSSNTNGSITSTVSVNTTAGFSVVSFDLLAAGSKTVGHGLGVAPKMVIIKGRTSGGAQPKFWVVYHASVGATAFLELDATAAAVTNSTVFDNTAPTSSVFTVGSGLTTANYGTSQIAYCWAEISGYSKAFSYTGNGSADGSFVYTGFLPRFVMIKRTDTTGDWYMWDTARNTYDVITNTLLANSSAAETSATSIDALSNGFKLRNTTAGFNASGGTYIGMAWATNPFKNSNAF